MSNRLMGRTALAGLLAFSLGGCEYLRVISFNDAEGSGDTRPFKVASEYAPSGSNSDGLESILAKYANPGAVRTACALPDVQAKAVAPLAAAAASFVVGQLISYVSSELQAAADELAARSQRTYRAKVLLVPDDEPFGKHCLIVERLAADEEETELAMALVLLVDPLSIGQQGPVGAVVKPVYLEFREGLAVTAEGEGIDLAVGIGMSVALETKNGPQIQQVSLGSFTLPQVKPGAVEDMFEAGEVGTGLVAMPPSSAKAIEITVAIMETGSAIPDTDKAKAEIQALEEAIGPVITDIVAERVGGL